MQSDNDECSNGRRHCGVEESVLRAFYSPDEYDPVSGRISPSLFKRKNTSLSRLYILPLCKQWEIFRNVPTDPQVRRFEGFGEILVGKIKELGLNHSQPRVLSVVEDPLDWNPAHAIVPERISESIAKQINSKLDRHLEETKCHEHQSQRVSSCVYYLRIRQVRNRCNRRESSGQGTA